jgi:hypothetical protein
MVRTDADGFWGGGDGEIRARTGLQERLPSPVGAEEGASEQGNLCKYGFTEKIGTPVCRGYVPILWELYVGVHEAARDLRVFKLAPKEAPAGAEARLVLLTLSARLKPCPCYKAISQAVRRRSMSASVVPGSQKLDPGHPMSW